MKPRILQTSNCNKIEENEKLPMDGQLIEEKKTRKLLKVISNPIALEPTGIN